MPISGSWKYKRSDTNFKSTTTLIRNLVDIASKGGNYLLNVSPTGDGTLLPEAVERLHAIGQWMQINSESIYGTTASPFAQLSWGRCTKKTYTDAAVLYLHVFDWPEDGELLVPGLKNQVEQTYLMSDWRTLRTRSTDSGVVVSLPEQAPDSVDSVIVMSVSGSLEIESTSPAQTNGGSLILSAESAYIHNNEAGRQARVQHHEGVPNIGYWTDAQAWVEWPLRIDRSGKYEIWAEVAVEASNSRFHIGLPDQHESVEVSSTGGYHAYEKKSLGTITISQAGDYTLQIRPDVDGWRSINVRQLVLDLK